ncbi:hypothetical protein B0H16DRAFT_1475274 [Mycena metata]|uniref:Uncharacterized protein n=1 Tax=Mycena metata TaxID=1033252 RepID=A0AAD7MIE9_9AGAR|nr:hypothetical protein B0H16DRAFT_1475274 [Mycena metata]
MAEARWSRVDGVQIPPPAVRVRLQAKLPVVERVLTCNVLGSQLTNVINARVECKSNAARSKQHRPQRVHVGIGRERERARRLDVHGNESALDVARESVDRAQHRASTYPARAPFSSGRRGYGCGGRGGMEWDKLREAR